MKPTLEFLLFTCGDSNDISTWSNVPYLFAKTLEKKGHKVNRVDISPNKYLNRLFNTLSYTIFKRILKLQACPEFHRTWLHRFIIYRRIKKATKQYPNSHINLFLSYAFYNKYSNKPSVLWCDWTDRIVIQRLGRAPKFYEIASLQHEDNVMKQADKVYTMFPVCKRQMQALYNRDIIHLERNVVNTVFSGEFDINQCICQRFYSKKIVFIGGKNYLGAAKELIKAFLLLYKKDKELELHIIGMTPSDLSVHNDNIFCHGYLRKNIKAQRDKYYHILHNCKVFVNPARQWGGYSSSIEALFYGCPIVVAPYNDFVEEFGKEICFGHYLDDNNLTNCIKKILDSSKDDYYNMCKCAYNSVANYTWDNYIDEFIESLKEGHIINE